MLRTTFLHRCPACGEGPLFRGSYALVQSCSACGLNLEGEHGAHYGGPIILGYGVSGLSGLTAFACCFGVSGTRRGLPGLLSQQPRPPSY
jgi:uncharacterized protein (DUF983 family)